MSTESDDSGDRTDVQVEPARVARPGSRHPYFIVVGGSTLVGKSFKLAGEMVIGRTGADIELPDGGISRRHAQITVGPEGQVVLTDLESTNGTFFNGERLSARTLEDGDKIQLGSTTILKLSYQDALDEALQKNLYESATRDALTRVYNKKFLFDALEKEIAYAVRHKMALSLIMLDVDHFKRINDTHGHPAGDYVLMKLAQVFLQIVRAEDLVARYGGEEFAVVLRHSEGPSAAACAERLRSGVEATELFYDGVEIPVTISAGVATLLAGEDPKALIARADEALYRAKSEGRNRVAV